MSIETSKMGTTLSFPFKKSQQQIKFPTVETTSNQTMPSSPKKKKVHDQSFYDSFLGEKSKIPLKSHRNFAFRRTTDATLLLSDYRPTEFGNTKIDLTIDGGQHLRSPGDEAPP